MYWSYISVCVRLQTQCLWKYETITFGHSACLAPSDRVLDRGKSTNERTNGQSERMSERASERITENKTNEKLKY